MKFKQIASQINKIINESNPELLEEGLRFGQREMKEIDKIAREIRIGVEYEYHVDDEHGNNDGERGDEFYDAVYNRAVEMIERDMEDKYDDFTSNFADQEMDEFNVHNVTSNLDDIKRRYDDVSILEPIIKNTSDALMNWDEDNMDNGLLGFVTKQEVDSVALFIKRISEEAGTIEEIWQNADDIEVDDQLDRIAYHLPGDGRYIEDNWDDFKTSAESFSDFANAEEVENEWMNVFKDFEQKYSTKDMFTEELITELKPIIEEFKEEFEEKIEGEYEEYYNMLETLSELSGDDTEWDRQVREGFEESAEDLWESEKEHIIGYDPDIPQETHFWEEAEEEIEREGDHESNGNKVETISELLHDRNNDWDIDPSDIEDVKPDGSVPDGVETVTEPQPLDEALDTMEKMFDHISDVGSTSSGTGMHVNMSFKHIDFSKKNFNPLKAVILLDPKTLKMFFNPRGGYTADIFDSIGFDDIFYLTQNIKGGRVDTPELVKHLNQILFSKRAKNQQINFSNVSDDVYMKRRRVEFRYFGGNDYEKRFNTIKFNIYRTAYVLLAAFSEDFGEKEYLSSILKLLDERSQKFYDTDFVELAKLRKESGIKTDDIDAAVQFSDYVSDSKSGRSYASKSGMRIR